MSTHFQIQFSTSFQSHQPTIETATNSLTILADIFIANTVDIPFKSTLDNLQKPVSLKRKERGSSDKPGIESPIKKQRIDRVSSMRDKTLSSKNKSTEECVGDVTTRLNRIHVLEKDADFDELKAKATIKKDPSILINSEPANKHQIDAWVIAPVVLDTYNLPEIVINVESSEDDMVIEKAEAKDTSKAISEAEYEEKILSYLAKSNVYVYEETMKTDCSSFWNTFVQSIANALLRQRLIQRSHFQRKLIKITEAGLDRLNQITKK